MFCFWGFWFCINCLSFNWCLIVYWLRATDLNFVHKFSQNCCCCCLMTPELKNPALKSHQSLLSLPFWSYFVLFLFRMIFFFLIRAVDFLLRASLILFSINVRLHQNSMCDRNSSDQFYLNCRVLFALMHFIHSLWFNLI